MGASSHDGFFRVVNASGRDAVIGVEGFEKRTVPTGVTGEWVIDLRDGYSRTIAVQINWPPEESGVWNYYIELDMVTSVTISDL